MAVISKTAISAFLDRDLADSRRAKRFTASAIRQKLKNLDPPPRFVHPPFHHQGVAFLLCAKYPGYLVLLDPGLGKTKVMLDLHAWRRKAGLAKRMLVLVPNASNVLTWENQVTEHTPWLRVNALEANGREKRTAGIMDTRAAVVVSTYAGLMSLVCSSRKKALKKPSGRAKTWVIDKVALRKVARLFDTIVMDECDTLANSQALPYRVCRQFCHLARYRYGLTGTPIDKEPEDFWAQFELVDDGATLGETLGMMRAAFFIEKKHYWSGASEYHFDKKKTVPFNRTLRHRSIRYAEEECNDLPKLVESDVVTVLPQSTWAYYDRLREKYTASRGDFRTVGGTYLQLRQVTAGYLGMLDPEDQRTQITFKVNPKLDGMEAEFKKLQKDRKVIIFHDLVATGLLIAERLRKMKVGFVHLYSGTSNPAKIQKAFDRDPKVRVMLASTAGAYGNNWQIANHVWFYECPSSPKKRRQMLKRSHRTGQTRTVFVKNFLVHNSLDVKILKAIRDGYDFFDAVVEGKDSL